MILDPERVVARMGKCFTPECDKDPKWFNVSWHRFCDEHVPDESVREKGVARKFHSFN
jgi:hypothetical protein